MRGTQTGASSSPKCRTFDCKFYCRAKRRDVDTESCINDFVTANAFENKRSACFRCHQGRKVREEFAGTLGNT
ncbi:MAG TPA: hypothetical protein PKH54_03145 [Myxococcota bacterium]|nr:hypothetical protein [Myxococcota bacterium]HOA12812.1 hypothetical protein [Myxococcota bacterium]HOC98913.1 hypothetical protein [Myxococcota bacterium]HOH76516.1 hypothetical protein [Myxococcota bacterium]HPV05165.1 hypothetical protein [Myxococcota bacterium]